MQTRIVLVDDHRVVCEGLRLLIEQEEDLGVVAEVSDGRAAMDAVRKYTPDLVIMDVSMPRLNGIDAAAQILEAYPHVKVLMLSAFSDRGFVTEALKAKVSGYVLKDSISEQLVAAIWTVVAGEQYLSPKIAGIVVSEYISNCQSGDSSYSLDTLTSKERELVQLLAEGHTSKSAARELHISGKTVDARRRSAMEKLSIKSLADLTKFAIREGLTTLDA